MRRPAVCKCGDPVEMHVVYVGMAKNIDYIREGCTVKGCMCHGYNPLIILGLAVIPEPEKKYPKEGWDNG